MVWCWMEINACNCKKHTLYSIWVLLHYRMIALRRKPNVWLPMYVFMYAIFVIIRFYINVIPCCNIAWIECCNGIFSRAIAIDYMVLLYHRQKILKKSVFCFCFCFFSQIKQHTIAYWYYSSIFYLYEQWYLYLACMTFLQFDVESILF